MSLMKAMVGVLFNRKLAEFIVVRRLSMAPYSIDHIVVAMMLVGATAAADAAVNASDHLPAATPHANHGTSHLPTHDNGIIDIDQANFPTSVSTKFDVFYMYFTDVLKLIQKPLEYNMKK